MSFDGRRLTSGRRAVGAVLLLLLLLPWYILVGGASSGPAAEQTLRLGGAYLFAAWAGSLATAVAVVALGLVVPARPAAASWDRFERALVTPPSGWFALTLGAGAAAIGGWVSAVVLERRPILLDGVSQLIQARYFAAGAASGPPLEDPAFWQFQFMVVTDSGWASQYPPGFAALLAVVGQALPLWLIGPLLLGLAVAVTSLVAERLFPDDLAVARLGAALTALSPFLAFHAGAYMNHVLALALVGAAMLCSLRAVDGAWAWSLFAGAATGALFATRPYTAVVLGFVAVVLTWALEPRGRAIPRARWLRHLGAAAAGAAPFVIATLLYNRRVFGALTRFGYVAGEGPAHALGFHADPWGNSYGPRQALGYTSADLQGLSLDLLQHPIPLAVVVALYLVFASRLPRGAALAASWALLPVAAQALYWHHDLFMGPRLLYESAPGWTLVFAAAVIAAVRAVPERGASWWRVRRGGLVAAFALGVIVTLAYTAPAKLASYHGVAVASGMSVTAPPVTAPALVFVHGGWEDRLAARLAATGMRVDSIRLALRSSSTCTVQRYVDALEARRNPQPTLTFASDPATAPRAFTMPSGSVLRSFDGETLTAECEREATSDFAGALGLPPLLWQGDLPGLPVEGAMFVRDLGPDRNQRLIERSPEREPMVLVAREGQLRLLSFDEGMRELWPSSPGS
jgi:4-amino-4-deoxy-L-arabinose transferase-like glycosyltransferase